MRTDAYSLIDGFNCVAMAGVFDVGFNRGIAWCLLSESAKNSMITITKNMRRYLDRANFNRIETTVEVGFKEGVRWMEMFGFTQECEMKNYCDGKSHYLYARYK